MTNSSPKLLVPKGSIVLVTGANGFLGSHVVEQFLNQGYKVRGTVRSLDKVSDLEARWNEKFPGLFEPVEIADLTKEGCYEKALQGVSAFVHTATDVTFSNDDDIIQGSIDLTLNALRSASLVPSIKSVVLTSSYICAAMPQVGQDGIEFDENSWNDQIIEVTKQVPKDDPFRGMFIYMTSKVESEKAAWNFVKEEKPSFTFNTVLPAFCFGEIFDPVKQHGSTAGITRDVFLKVTNERAKVTPIPQDIALLHVGAATLESFENHRFFGISDVLTWNEILSIFRRLYPDRDIFEDFDDRRKEDTKYDTKSALELLKEVGQTGWKPIEEAIRENVENFA
ncbi:hypothetical protein JCM16303_005392 [Sporobolomyces ruberrimus]